MKRIMIQKITQNNWNFWTVNLIMRAKKIVNHSSDFPVRRTGSYRHKKALPLRDTVTRRFSKMHVAENFFKTSRLFLASLHYNYVNIHP